MGMCFPLIIVEEVWFISNSILQFEVCYLNLLNKTFKSYCYLGSEGKQQLISPKSRVVTIRILFNLLCLLRFITRDIHGQGSSAWTIGMVHQLLLYYEGNVLWFAVQPTVSSASFTHHLLWTSKALVIHSLPLLNNKLLFLIIYNLDLLLVPWEMSAFIW